MLLRHRPDHYRRLESSLVTMSVPFRKRHDAIHAFCAILLLLCLGFGTGRQAMADAIGFTDMAGRQIALDKAPQRIALGDGRLLTAFALVSPEPVARVVASADNFRRFDPASYDAYLKRFPELGDLADLGAPTAELSAEGLLSTEPDLVLLPLWLHNDRSVEQTMAAAGVPVAYIDFFSDPVAGMPKAMRIIGAILERRMQAEAFISFHEEHMAEIRRRLEKAARPKPSVFLHARSADWDCCWSATGKVGDMIAFAGGDNIADGMFASQTGRISLEFVLAKNPDVYIAASSSNARRPGDFPIGEGVGTADVRSALKAIGDEPAIGTLSAVTEGRTHGLWLFFFQSPVYVVAVEAMAKWFHPELFADLDPAATLEEINRSYLAVPMTGTFFADSKAAR